MKEPGAYGSANALRALKYVSNGSNSPMETMMDMLRILPFSYGGFSISGQELNAQIILSKEAASVFRRKSCVVDALWRDIKVVFEYDSNKTHLNAQQHDHDKRKILALEMDGYKVFPVTYNMVSTIWEIENTFVMLRKMLGKRTDLSRIEQTREKRRELIQFLRSV